MDFNAAFTALIGVEGGYTNNPDDPGGETKYGISKRAYPNVDIKNLTLDQAKAIYLADYWKPAGCDLVPDAVRYDLFDMAVNSGVDQAVKTLQQALGVKSDGNLGPISQKAAASADPYQTLARFNGYRLAYMVGLPQWVSFSRGWARRIALNLTRS